MRLFVAVAAALVLAFAGAPVMAVPMVDQPTLTVWASWQVGNDGVKTYFCTAFVLGAVASSVSIDRCEIYADGILLGRSGPSVGVGNVANTVPGAPMPFVSGNERYMCWAATADVGADDPLTNVDCQDPI